MKLTDHPQERLAREAVDWIGSLTWRRHTVPLPSFDDDSDQGERLMRMQLYHSRLKFQAYDVAMALSQIFHLMKHLEEEPPAQFRDELARFLSAMRSGRLIHLRDIFVHYDEFIAGTMDQGQIDKKMGTWEEHQAESPEKGVGAAAREDVFESMKQGFGARYDEGGVTMVSLLGRSYSLMEAYDAALKLGPPLSRWSGRLLVQTEEGEEDTP